MCIDIDIGVHTYTSHINKDTQVTATFTHTHTHTNTYTQSHIYTHTYMHQISFQIHNISTRTEQRTEERKKSGTLYRRYTTHTSREKENERERKREPTGEFIKQRANEPNNYKCTNLINNYLLFLYSSVLLDYLAHTQSVPSFKRSLLQTIYLLCTIYILTFISK